MDLWLKTRLSVVLFGTLVLLGPSTQCFASAEPDAVSKPACDSWNSIIEKAKDVSGLRLLCNINEYCSGINCSGKYKDYKGKIEVRLEHCSGPVTLQVRLSVPRVIKDWSHTYYPGKSEMLTLPSDSKDANISLDMYMRQPNKATVQMSFSIAIRSDPIPIRATLLKNDTITLSSCRNGRDVAVTGNTGAIPPVPILKPLMQNGAIANIGEKHCDLSKLEDCAHLEICEQVVPNSREGHCTCLPGYQRNSYGDCDYPPIVPVTTTSSPTKSPEVDNNSKSSGSSQSSAVQIAVPILLIVTTAVLVVFAYKYRWVTKLRARFRRVQIYEEMIIEGDETSSNHSQGSNAIA